MATTSDDLLSDPRWRPQLHVRKLKELSTEHGHSALGRRIVAPTRRRGGHVGALPRPDLPPGPGRDLNDALHELHHRAGWPSLRAMARDAGVSHTTVSHVFSAPKLPTWGVVEVLVEALGGGTAHFHDLWLAATATEDVARPATARLAGRGAELTTVCRHLETGTGLLLVTGEAGIGKTRLVTTAAEQTECFVATGHCLPLTTEVPLLPIADTLQSVYDADSGRWLAQALAACPDYVPTAIARLVPQAVPHAPEDVGPEARQRLFTAYLEVSKTLAATRRIAVLVEDLHWADTATLDLLEHTILRGRDFCLLATWRTEDETIAPSAAEWFARARRLSQVTELDLRCLDRDETAEQLTLLDGRVTADQVDRIHARSQGQPLFTEQLSAHLDDDQALPRLLLDLLDRRLAGLSGTAWAVIRVLGVAARPMTAAQLARATGLDRARLTTDLRALQARRLVHTAPSDTVELHHPLLAEATRRRLVPGEAAEVHFALAETLGAEPGTSPAEVAAHWQGAEVPAREIGWRVAAARDSAAGYDWAQSAEHWLRVLELWPMDTVSAGEPPISRASAYLAAIDMLNDSLQWDRAAAMSDRAEEQLGEVDDAIQAELLRRAAEYRGEREGVAVGMILIDAALEIYGRLPPSVGLLQALNQKRLLLTSLGRYHDAYALTQSAADVAVEIGDRRMERHHLATLAWHEGVGGDASSAIDNLEQGRRITGDTDPTGDIRQAVMATDLLLLCGGALDAIEAAARQGFRTAQEWGIDSEAVLMLRQNVAVGRIRAGRIRSADELIQVRPDEPADPDRWPLHLIAATIEALGGQLDVASERIDTLWREVGPDDEIDLEFLAAVADIDFWNGTPAASLPRLLQDLDLVVDSAPVRIVCAALVTAARAAAEMPSHGSGSSAHLTTLRDLQARAMLDPASAPADTHLRAHAFAAAAELARGDTSERIEHWVKAAAHWDKLARPHDAAYSRWRAAQVALHHGHGTLATRLLKRAATAAREHVPLTAAIASTKADIR